MGMDLSRERTGGMAASLARMLTTLEQKVDPSHAALIVVDVQNDFCAPDGYFAKEFGDTRLVREMVPRLVKFIEKAREAKLPIIYIQCEYNTENSWYLSDVWLEHAGRKRTKGGYVTYPICEPNSWAAEFYEGIKPLSGEVVVKKHRYNAFLNTDLDLILRSKGIRTLIMSGVASDVCVQATGWHGFMLDYYIVFLEDCTATYSQELHDAALKKVDALFGEVVNSGSVIESWEKMRKGG